MKILKIDEEVNISIGENFIDIVKEDAFGITAAVMLTVTQMRDVCNVYQAHAWQAGVVINED